MSYTEIYGFDKEGNGYLEGEVRNAFRGAHKIWSILEDKYLPLYIPSYLSDRIKNLSKEAIIEYLGYTPTRLNAFMDDKAMKEVWDLYHDDRLPNHEQIVLGTTFDYALIKRENFDSVIEAFRKFEGETSLKEQADIIEKMKEDENCIALGFNQTSVNGDTWSNFGGYDEDTDEEIPYNFLTGDKHWFLFKVFKENKDEVQNN
jgi:hypothetical protein